MAKIDMNVIYVKVPNRMNWITTFCDMLTILLCFFVLIISMSSMDNKALQSIFGFFSSVSGPLGFPQEHGINGAPPVSKPLPQVVYRDTETLNRSLMLFLSKRIIRGVPGQGTGSYAVQVTNRGFAIRVPGDILFDLGTSVIKRDALPVLQAIADVIKSTDSTIAIEGNTDSIGNEEANWKLSLKRAISIVDFFEYTEGLSPSRFCVAGYGSMRPVAPNDTEEGRAKNRRVEIILLKDRL
jgi:chemotaxis protein MotB